MPATRPLSGEPARCRAAIANADHRRVRRILRKGVQNVGQHQFLMLLLVVQADLQDRENPFGLLRGFDQRWTAASTCAR